MPHILKNKDLELHIDLPSKGYQKTRFDWTGKITKVKFKGIEISSTEQKDDKSDDNGKGFYNEFGIENPVGYNETAPNGWFHKVGIGLLQRDNEPYDFSKVYPLQPLDFKIIKTPNKLTITCQSASINGYAYILKKEIQLSENTWTIHYSLENIGTKTIQTDEYVHNFIALDKVSIGSDYILKFPFTIQPQSFIETVNPEGKVEIGESTIQFNDSPHIPFFFSNLSGGKPVKANWKLINTKSKISICETTDFQTSKVNLWGTQHVISPELFFEINIEAGRTLQWSRTYHLEIIEL